MERAQQVVGTATTVGTIPDFLELSAPAQLPSIASGPGTGHVAMVSRAHAWAQGPGLACL